MLKKRVFIVLIFSLFAISCYNKAFLNIDPSISFTHPYTGIFLPREIGSLDRTQIIKYAANSGAGFSAHYQNRDFIKASIFIFNGGLPKIQPGIDDQNTERYYNQTLQEILKMQTMGYYSNIVNSEKDTVDFTIKGNNLKAYFSTLSYVEAELNLTSHIFISSFMDHFIKIRYTYPKSMENDGKKIWNDVIAIFNTGKNSYNFNPLLNNLKNNEDIKDKDNDALICAKYITENKFELNDINWSISKNFLMQWIEKTPKYSFTVNKYSSGLLTDGDDLFVIYCAFYADILINNLHNDDIDCQVESFKKLIRFCQKNDIPISNYKNLSTIKTAFDLGKLKELLTKENSK